MRVGLVTWAATTGALVGFGLRHDGATGSFARFGAAIMATTVAPRPPIGVAVATGLVGHALWMVMWGVAFSMLARSRRWLPAAAFALLLAGIATVLSDSWLPAALGAVRSASLAPPQLALVLVLMAGSLVTSLTFVRAR